MTEAVAGIMRKKGTVAGIALMLLGALAVERYAVGTGLSYRELIVAIAALIGGVVVFGGERGIRFGLVLWTLMLAVGYRSLRFTPDLTIHPAEVLAVAAFLLHLCSSRAGGNHKHRVAVLDVALHSFLRARVVAVDRGRCKVGQNAQRVSLFRVADSAADGRESSTEKAGILALSIARLFLCQQLDSVDGRCRILVSGNNRILSGFHEPTWACRYCGRLHARNFFILGRSAGNVCLRVGIAVCNRAGFLVAKRVAPHCDHRRVSIAITRHLHRRLSQYLVDRRDSGSDRLLAPIKKGRACSGAGVRNRGLRRISVHSENE